MRGNGQGKRLRLLTATAIGCALLDRYGRTYAKSPASGSPTEDLRKPRPTGLPDPRPTDLGDFSAVSARKVDTNPGRWAQEAQELW